MHISGEDLTVTDWNGGDPIVTIPLHIALEWEQDYTVEVTDDSGAVTLPNITLSTPTDWEWITYDGLAHVDDVGFVAQALADLSITMVAGDIFAIEKSANMTVNDSGSVTIDPASTVLGAYKIWDVSASAFTSVGSYEWVDAGALAAPVFSGVITDQSGMSGTSVNLDVSSYFTGATSYSLNAVGANAGLSINNAGEITGTLPAATTISGIVVTGINAEDGVESNPFVWAVSEANNPPVVTAPTDIEIQFVNGGAGLAKDDSTLLAWLASAFVVDDSDILTVSGDLSALADPIPAGGPYTITFLSSADSGLLTDTDTAQLTVSEAAAVNNAPTFTSGNSFSAIVGVSVDHTVTTNDVDGDSLTITEFGAWPAGYSLVDNNDGTATITVLATAAGGQAITVRANDGAVDVDHVVTVNVAAAPVQGSVDSSLYFDTPSSRTIAVKRIDDSKDAVFQQDPAERNDYLVDVSRYLEGDPVVSVIWSSDAGINIVSGGTNERQSLVWVEGGATNVNYEVQVILTSQKGRRKKVKFLIAINED